MAPKRQQRYENENDAQSNELHSSGEHASDPPAEAPPLNPADILPRPENILKLIKDFSGNAEDWMHWKTRLVSVFSIYNIAVFLQEAESVPSGDWKLSLVKERAILGYIFNILILVVDPETQVLIRHGCDGNGMMAWKILCERFQGTVETRALDLRMRLQVCR